MIIPVSSYKIPQYAYKSPISKKGDNEVDFKETELIKKVPSIKIAKYNNATKITFRGNFVDPAAPAIQFKIRGVSSHQKDYSTNFYSKDRNVENLANSDWYDGKKLDFEIAGNNNNKRILIKDPQYGELGRMPDSVSPFLVKLLDKHPEDFTFQLSNVLAGNTKGAPTIGLRANLIYTGTNEKFKKRVADAFDDLLNSNEKEISDVIMLYQPQTRPKDVLQKIFSNVESTNGEDEAYRVLDIVDNISDEINDPKNENILLLGHTGPDGDTIGCVLGLHAAIKANYPNKKVICSIDDKIPGIYRDKLPGIHNISRPGNADTILKLKEQLAELAKKPKSFITRSQMRTIEKEISALKRNLTIFSKDTENDEIPTKYDLVILMDVPSPTKFTTSYKNEIENAGKVIYIDHHRDRFEDWHEQQFITGLNMQEVRNNNLALVIPEVPAATELVTVVADNAGLLEKTFKNAEFAKQFVAAIVSGTSSDTGGFARTANYNPEDMSKPIQERPNFFPEGMSKWLITKLDNIVNKKWLRENIVYDISDKKATGMPKSAREKMIDYANDSTILYPSNGFGVIEISYEQLYDIWKLAKLFDKQVTFGDIQNSIKYSEVMNSLREAKNTNDKKTEIEPYKTTYENDKISLLLIQDKKAGCPNDEGQIEEENSIRMSFRSQEGTIFSEQLAALFGGGGHGNAAGARITLPNIELNTPVSIKIDGEIEYNPQKILDALDENFKIKNSKENFDTTNSLPKFHKFETVIDECGLPINELINNIITEMRFNEGQ